MQVLLISEILSVSLKELRNDCLFFKVLSMFSLVHLSTNPRRVELLLLLQDLS